jgi:TPR repeat protein
VQHAHQKGIIHRDLKPANVLVTQVDGRAVPKIIDFGVAKATGQQLTEKTMFTNFTQMIGTPLYMSPEQAEMTCVDVDTRSDIYSLGVLLYELLTGTTPFDRQRLRTATFDEVRHMIREEEPPRPSTRLSTLAQAEISTLCAKRQSEPRQIHRLLCGELDWIVMKALEKDRNRRYETASALAADVERYLNDDPVLACPPSAAYRLRKLARRNKGALVTAGLLASALVLTIAVLTVSNVLVVQERDEKDLALKQKSAALNQAKANQEAADHQRYRAEENAKLATTVLDEIIVQEASRRANAYTHDRAKRLTTDPQREKQEAAFLEKGLRFYEQLAQTNDADRSARRERARAYRQLGWLQHVLGEEGQSAQAFRQSIRLWQELADESPGEFEAQYGVADAYHCLFDPLASGGETQEAEEANRHARDAFATLAAHFPTEPRCLEGVADCELHWSWLLLDKQKLLEGEQAIRRTLSVWEKLAVAYPEANDGTNRWHVADTYRWLGEVLRRRGLLAESIEALKHNVAILEKLVAERRYENERWDLACSYEDLGRVLSQAARFEEADAANSQAESGLDQLVSEFNEVDQRRHLAVIRDERGHFLEDRRRFEEAVESYRRASVTWDKLATEFKNPDDRAHLSSTRKSLGYCLWQAAESLRADGKFDKVELSLVESDKTFELLAKDFPEEPSFRQEQAHTEWKLGVFLVAAGQVERAEDHFRTSAHEYAALVNDFPQESFYLQEEAYSTMFLAEALKKSGQGDESDNEFRRAAELHRKAAEMGNTTAQHRLGQQYLKGSGVSKDPVEAMKLIQSAARQGNQNAQLDLANMYAEGRGTTIDDAAAAKWYRRAADHNQPGALIGLGQLYAHGRGVEKNETEAVKLYRRAAEILRTGGRNNVVQMNELAWCLATNDIETTRDPALAIEFAQKAVEAEPRDGNLRNTLGVALYRAGNWQAAIDGLNKSIELKHGGDAYDDFFMAMALQRSGRPDEARNWFDKGVKWMGKMDSQPEELRRVYQEASGVVSVSPVSR